jgi:hypothetical protein
MLFGVGITNPFGPTLSIVGADGTFENEGTLLPIIDLMLNPFSQECQIVGEVKAGATWNAMEDLPQFFSLLEGSGCPNLLLPLANLQQEAVIDLYAHLLMQFPDAGEMWAMIRKHPGNPVQRVQEEINGLANSIKTPRSTGDAVVNLERKVVEQSGKNLELGEARELAATQLKPKNVKAELNAFFFAWNGSIEFQRRSAPGQTDLSFEDFLKFFAVFTASSGIFKNVFDFDMPRNS